MQRRATPRVTNPDATLGGRLSSALVAWLFFAPLLAVLWWLGNFTLAWYGNADRQIPAAWLLAAIGASAVLGFLAPRTTPAVFGWIADFFHRVAKLWWR